MVVCSVLCVVKSYEMEWNGGIVCYCNIVGCYSQCHTTAIRQLIRPPAAKQESSKLWLLIQSLKKVLSTLIKPILLCIGVRKAPLRLSAH